MDEDWTIRRQERIQRTTEAYAHVGIEGKESWLEKIPWATENQYYRWHRLDDKGSSPSTDEYIESMIAADINPLFTWFGPPHPPRLSEVRQTYEVLQDAIQNFSDYWKPENDTVRDGWVSQQEQVQAIYDALKKEGRL
jgi:hypothetical protein